MDRTNHRVIEKTGSSPDSKGQLTGNEVSLQILNPSF